MLIEKSKLHLEEIFTHPCSSRIIHYNQKAEAKCSLIGDWINKMWSIHTMPYYSALQRKEIPIYVIT